MSNIIDIEKRKVQHIELAKNLESQIQKPVFEDITLPYKALPEINLSDVNTQITLLNKTLSQPLIIASMTGGTTHAKTINTNIAIAANETNIAFGVGSQRIALQLPDAIESFSVTRRLAPNAFIFANMGAVQLNFGKTVDDYKKVIDMIKADALYLHINALQEAIQPEGDTDFSNLLKKIANLVKNIQVPIFVKEVGHGLDIQTIKSLIEIGIKGIDVAGANGTSWAWIEAKRKGSEELACWFKDFGLTTEKSLQNAVEFKTKGKVGFEIVASGGIRTPIQGLKAITLGANYYSAAKPFLEPALTSPDMLIKTIQDWQKGLQVAMFCCGIKTIKEIQ